MTIRKSKTSRKTHRRIKPVEYVSSVPVSPKPIEMTNPVRLWVLVLMAKGWVADSYLITPRTSRIINHSLWRGRHDLNIRFNNSQTIALWRRASYVEEAPFNECSTKRVLQISAAGRELVSRLAPEILAAASAHARALIGHKIRENRRIRFRDREQIEIQKRFRTARKSGVRIVS